MAHSSHLGELFKQVPKFGGQLALGHAHNRARACLLCVCVACRGARRRSIASSHPLPSGAPQAVYGTTAIFSGGADIDTAATATTAAAPLRCWGPRVRAFFWRYVEVALWPAFACFGGLSCSFLVRWPRAEDAASGWLGSGRFHVGLCVPICVQL